MTSKVLFKKVEEVFGVDIEEIQSISRLRTTTDARKALVYFLRKYLKMGSNAIAKIINKGHDMIVYYYREAESLIKYDENYKNKIYKIQSELNL